MIGKIIAYLAGLITGFMFGSIYSSGIFEFLFKNIPGL